jgi:hypothetical protein
VGSFHIWALSWVIVILVGLSPMLGVVVIRYLARLLHRKAEGQWPRGASADRAEAPKQHPEHVPPPR